MTTTPPNPMDNLTPDRLEGFMADPVRAKYVETCAEGDARFGFWLFLIDAALVRRIGLHHLDLVEWPWRTAYEEGMAPSVALRLALVEDRIPVELLLTR